MRNSERLVVLDGPMGTELAQMGCDTSLPLWSARPMMESPERVVKVHLGYLRAGADIVTTNTFRTNLRTFEQAGLGLSDAKNATQLAVDCASRARALAGRPGARVAGSIAPVEDCYHPERVPSEGELAEEHGLLARWLAEGGVDLILVETMNSILEARVAVRAAAETGLPVWASVICSDAYSLLSGEPLAAAVPLVIEAGATAVGVNCIPIELTDVLVAEVSAATSFPVIAYPNGGIADRGSWTPDTALTAARFADRATHWIDGGASIIGGCCGTDSSHIEALRRVVDNRVPPA